MYEKLVLIIQHRMRHYEPRRRSPRPRKLSASFTLSAASGTATLCFGDGGDQWSNWLRAALLLGLKLAPHIVDWSARMVGALSRVGGSIAEWASGPLGSRVQANSA